MNKNELQVFENENLGSLRTVEIDNQIWFVGKDVALILGYKNTKQAIIAHVENEDKLRYKFDTPAQKRDVIIINESGLYSLLLSSKLPKAKEFKHWVTSEILPSIRKNKSYSVNNSSFEETLKMIAQNVLLLTEIVKQNSQRLYDLEKRNEIKQVPEMSIRAEINKIIRSYAVKEEISISQAWKELYQEFYYRKHINISKRADRLNVSKLDYAEENDLLEDLKLIAQKL